MLFISARNLSKAAKACFCSPVEELRQYFERVFRLATVRRKVDLAQLVRWIDKDDGQPLFAGTLSQGSGER